MDTANEIEVLEADRKIYDKLAMLINDIKTHVDVYRKVNEYDEAHKVLDQIRQVLEVGNE